MSDHDARRVLGHLGAIRHRCDLDLLLFFVRHPRSLLTSEHLAGFLGYELKQIAESLERLLDAGLVGRAQSPAHAARLYVLTREDPSGGWLPPLLELAATRKGRLALIEGLSKARDGGDVPGTESSRDNERSSRQKPFLVRRGATNADSKAG